jgi:hypothetical protein
MSPSAKSSPVASPSAGRPREADANDNQRYCATSGGCEPEHDGDHVRCVGCGLGADERQCEQHQPDQRDPDGESLADC